MTHKRGDTPEKRYPGPNFINEVFVLLKDSTRGGETHIPTFARHLLEQLRNVGLLHTTDDEAPVNVRRVRLASEGKVQDVWLRFDTTRVAKGYTTVEVVKAPRSDATILAAMIASATELMNLEELLSAMAARRAWDETMGPLATTSPPWGGRDLQVLQDRSETYLQNLKKVLEGEGVVADEWEGVIGSFLSDITDQHGEAGVQLSLILHLIRYYRPGFDEYSVWEKLDLIKKAHTYISEYLRALGNLQSFFEFGAPDRIANDRRRDRRTNRRKLRPVIENPEQDVQAAILFDVEDLTFPQIAKRLGMPEPKNYNDKRDHQTASDAVKRGRHILEKAFGKEGWRKRVEAMRTQLSWWRSLSRDERHREDDIYYTALDLGISIEEARRRVERRRS